MPNNNRLKLEISDIKKFSVDPLFYLNNLKKDYKEIVITGRGGSKIIFNLENLTNSDITPFEAYRSSKNTGSRNLLVIGIGKTETGHSQLWFYDINDTGISYWDRIYTKQDMIKNDFAKISLIFLEPLIKDEELTEQEKITKIKEALENGAMLSDVKERLFVDIVRLGHATLALWLLEKNPRLISAKNENTNPFQRLVLITIIQAYLNKSSEKSVLEIIKKLLPELNSFINDKQIRLLYTAITSQFVTNSQSLQLPDCTLPELNLLKGYRFQMGQGESMNMEEAMKYYFMAFEKANEEQKKPPKKITQDDWFTNTILDSIKNLVVIKLNELIPSDTNGKIKLYYKIACCYFWQEQYVTVKETLEKIKEDIKDLTIEDKEFQEIEYLNSSTDFNLSLKSNSEDEKIKLLQSASKQGSAPASVLLAEHFVQQTPSKFMEATQYYIAALNAKYEFDPNKVITNLSHCLEKLKTDPLLSESELYEFRLQVVWAIREKLEAGEKNPQIYKPLLDKLDDFILAKYVTLVYCDAPSSIFNQGKITKELKVISETRAFIPAFFTYAEWREQGINGLQKNTWDAFLRYWRVVFRCAQNKGRSELEIKIINEFESKAKEKIKKLIENITSGKIKPDINFEFFQQIYTALTEKYLDKRLEKLRAIESTDKFQEIYKIWYEKLSKADDKTTDIDDILAKEVLFPQNTNSNIEKKTTNEENLYPLLKPDNINSLNPSAPFVSYPDLNNLALNINLTKETVMLSTPNLGETNLSTEMPLQNQTVAAKEEIKILPENQNIAHENLSELNQNTSVAETAPSSAELLSLSQEQNVDLEMKFDPITLSDIHNSSSEESLSESENTPPVTPNITTENLSQPDANEFLLDDLKIEPQNQSNLNQTEIKIEDSPLIESKIDSSLKQIENVESSLEQKTIYSQDIAAPTPSPKKMQANNKNAFWSFTQRNETLDNEINVLSEKERQLLKELEEVRKSKTEKQAEKQKLEENFQSKLGKFNKNKVPNAEEAWKENELNKTENRMEKNPTPKGRTLV